MQDFVLPELLASACPAQDVSRFSDDSGERRAIALTQNFYVYALKDRSRLRVLSRENVDDGWRFKGHTQPVEKVVFESDTSTLAASTSAAEMFVWKVRPSERRIDALYCFKTHVVAATWLRAKDRQPDMLLIHKKSNGYVASALRGALEAASSNPDFEPTSTHLTPMTAGSVTATTPLVAADAPLLAFSVTDTTVVTCMVSNTATPAWQPCDGETVVGMSLLGDSFVSASKSQVALWDVAGEPHPLWRIRIRDASCFNLLTTSSNVIAFLKRGGQDGCTVAVLRTDPLQSAFFSFPNASQSSCDVSLHHRTLAPLLLLNNSDDNVLQCFHLTDGQFVDVSPMNAPAGAIHVLAPPSVAVGMPMPIGGPRLRNPALSGALDPAVGPTTPGSQECGDVETQIKNSLDSTQELLALTNKMVIHDHEERVREALRAQMQTVIDRMTIFLHEGAQATHGVAPGSPSIVDGVIRVLIEETAKAVVESVRASVQEQVRSNLENYLRQAMAKQIRKQEKVTSADSRSQIDSLMAGVMDQVRVGVQNECISFSNNLHHNAYALSQVGEIAASSLHDMIVKLKNQLNDVTSSGIIEEVRALRQEVAELKAGHFSQAVQEGSPETIVTRAHDYMNAGDPCLALEWILKAKDPQALMQLLEKGDLETLLRADIGADIWAAVVTALVADPRESDRCRVLQIVEDILLDKEELPRNLTLMRSVTNMVDGYKSCTSLSYEAREALRRFSIIIRQ